MRVGSGVVGVVIVVIPRVTEASRTVCSSKNISEIYSWLIFRFRNLVLLPAMAVPNNNPFLNARIPRPSPMAEGPEE